jgi:hypothetical protein
MFCMQSRADEARQSSSQPVKPKAPSLREIQQQELLAKQKAAEQVLPHTSPRAISSLSAPSIISHVL